MDPSYLPQPPFFLLLVGLFVGLTCGLAFEATLKDTVNTWYKTPGRSERNLLETGSLQLPFLGICLGICIFLASGLEIFIADRWLAYALSLPMTLFIAGLVWTQLGILLVQLQRGGSKALDLDTF
jgi:hypothetical protein